MQVVMEIQFEESALVLGSFVVVTRPRRTGADPENTGNKTNGSVGLNHQSAAMNQAIMAEDGM